MGNKVIFSVHDNVEQLQYPDKVYLTFITELWKTCSVKNADALSVKQRETFVSFILPTSISVQVYLLGFILFSPNKSWYHQVEYGGQHWQVVPPHKKKNLVILAEASDSYLVNPGSYLIVYIPKFTSFFSSNCFMATGGVIGRDKQ